MSGLDQRDWPGSEAEWEAEVRASEAKYRRLVNHLRPAEVAGLSNVVRERISHLNDLLKADSEREMRERSPSRGLGNRP